MEFKGTKGKWFIWREDLIVTDYDTKEDVVCIKPQIKNIENWKANALLISKAPEMLEMLQSLLNESEDIVHSEIKKHIEQLIKEATEI
jgi:hypothetical protein